MDHDIDIIISTIKNLTSDEQMKVYFFAQGLRAAQTSQPNS